MRKPEIQKAIKEAQEQRIKRLNVDADYVLHRLVEIDQMDVLDIMNDDLSLKPISEWPPIWRQYISGLDNMEEFDGRGDDRTMIGYLRKIKNRRVQRACRATTQKPANRSKSSKHTAKPSCQVEKG